MASSNRDSGTPAEREELLLSERKAAEPLNILISVSKRFWSNFYKNGFSLTIILTTQKKYRTDFLAEQIGDLEN